MTTHITQHARTHTHTQHKHIHIHTRRTNGTVVLLLVMVAITLLFICVCYFRMLRAVCNLFSGSSKRREYLAWQRLIPLPNHCSSFYFIFGFHDHKPKQPSSHPLPTAPPWHATPTSARRSWQPTPATHARLSGTCPSRSSCLS